MHNNKVFIECIILPYQSKRYLLPCVAMAELIVVDSNEQNNSQPFGCITWRELVLPLFTWNLQQVDPKQNAHLHLAVMNAIHLTHGYGHSYFGVLFDDKPSKIRLKSDNIQWQDESLRTATISKESKTAFDVFIPDYEKLCQDLSKIIQ